ncbi:hypothetical protein [Aurantiacibacter gangjinensis]|uniref:Uncharacterized protein n=1 Tax=Aurantiacibacter gangjinensis TaxID=502682 RepID=A0A0G9MK38_9SPHN|nr:hypothetical protein [Aurantiacibacter gangjinensis]APE29369.1 hypothetical protein BMF35_b0114 [Aurantiacibacter gangjinensis]KLE31055.1 hypothetical protein AAW01_12430 [Aurantiacibacter gangjinensis]
MTPRIALIAAAPLLLLSACEEEAAIPEGDDGREASGEVLEGSISDDMLPIAETRSQPPLRAGEEGDDD